jgi:hypothetical protein
MLPTLNFYNICEAVYGIQAVINLLWLYVNQVLLWTNTPESQNCLKAFRESLSFRFSAKSVKLFMIIW